MSHTVTIETKFRSESALRAACDALELDAPERGEAQFYDRSTHEGTLVRLPGWKYPIVVDDEGAVHFDNYNGSWGRMETLNNFRQQYSRAVVQETMGGEWMFEQSDDEDGAIRLTASRY